jgi:hypothetical protein
MPIVFSIVKANFPSGKPITIFLLKSMPKKTKMMKQIIKNKSIKEMDSFMADLTSQI